MIHAGRVSGVDQFHTAINFVMRPAMFDGLRYSQCTWGGKRHEELPCR